MPRLPQDFFVRQHVYGCNDSSRVGNAYAKCGSLRRVKWHELARFGGARGGSERLDHSAGSADLVAEEGKEVDEVKEREEVKEPIVAAAPKLRAASSTACGGKGTVLSRIGGDTGKLGGGAGRRSARREEHLRSGEQCGRC